ncbi:MAG: transposase [Candidatus Aenigmarchaeota archaeon]|nr:transposase [Candidatus Aenigmarchaeota archaeon]
MSVICRKSENVIQRTYKFRMYPSKTTEKKLLDTLEICRQTYNDLLGISIETYQHTGKGLSNFGMNNCINYMGGVDKTDVHSQVLQNVSDRLGKAFQNFFRRIKEKKVKAGFPRFKKDIRSFTYPQSGYKLDNHKLRLSKIGEINLRIGRKQNRINGNIKTLTIKKMPSGKWFSMFSCEMKKRGETHNFPQNSIGIDVGLEKFATLSNGAAIENPRFLVKSERRLKLLSRRFSKKKKGSKEMHDSRVKLARMHERISNQRHDFIHKTTKMIADNFGLISVENLNIKGMVKHPYLAKHINDASWGNFVQILGYKAESAGGQVVKVNPRGTSQTCSQCGNNVPKTLAMRWHMCPACGLHIGRDLNSAKEMLNRATAGTAERYADGDGSPPLREIFEGSLSKKSEAPQLVGE